MQRGGCGQTGGLEDPGHQDLRVGADLGHPVLVPQIGQRDRVPAGQRMTGRQRDPQRIVEDAVRAHRPLGRVARGVEAPGVRGVDVIAGQPVHDLLGRVVMDRQKDVQRGRGVLDHVLQKGFRGGDGQDGGRVHRLGAAPEDVRLDGEIDLAEEPAPGHQQARARRGQPRGVAAAQGQRKADGLVQPVELTLDGAVPRPGAPGHFREIPALPDRVEQRQIGAGEGKGKKICWLYF